MMFTTKVQIKKWIDEMMVKSHLVCPYVINDDLTLDVNGHVMLRGQSLKVLPVQFGIVNRSFDCSINELTSLLGSPKEIKGSFLCFCNKLASLKGVTQIIPGELLADRNELTSLRNSPLEVHRNFDCSHNQIKSLKGASKIVKGDFRCNINQLRSLKYAPQVLNNFECYDNQIINYCYNDLNIGKKISCSHSEKDKITDLLEYYENNKLSIPFELLKSYIQKKQLNSRLNNELNISTVGSKKIKI